MYGQLVNAAKVTRRGSTIDVEWLETNGMRPDAEDDNAVIAEFLRLETTEGAR